MVSVTIMAQILVNSGGRLTAPAVRRYRHSDEREDDEDACQSRATTPHRVHCVHRSFSPTFSFRSCSSESVHCSKGAGLG